MSGMSHQEEWMPSMVKVILPIQDGDYTDGEIQRAFWLTGLRAQIAVLGSLIAHMRQRYTTPENPTGSYCNEESCWIADKIHALRKELGE